jgi:hypothetical protein
MLAERAKYQGTDCESEYIDTESHRNESRARHMVVMRDIRECGGLRIE